MIRIIAVPSSLSKSLLPGEAWHNGTRVTTVRAIVVTAPRKQVDAFAPRHRGLPGNPWS